MSATVTPRPPNEFGDRPSVRRSVLTCGAKKAASGGPGRFGFALGLTIASAEQPSDTVLLHKTSISPAVSSTANEPTLGRSASTVLPLSVRSLRAHAS